MRRRRTDDTLTPCTPWDQVPQALTLLEAATLLRCSRDEVLRKLACGELKSLRIGREHRIGKGQVARLLGEEVRDVVIVQHVPPPPTQEQAA